MKWSLVPASRRITMAPTCRAPESAMAFTVRSSFEALLATRDVARLVKQAGVNALPDGESDEHLRSEDTAQIGHRLHFASRPCPPWQVPQLQPSRHR